jgi:hypothetical protein
MGLIVMGFSGIVGVMLYIIVRSMYKIGYNDGSRDTRDELKEKNTE